MSPVTVRLILRSLAAAPCDFPVFGQVDDDWAKLGGFVRTIAVWLCGRQTALTPRHSARLFVDDVWTLLGLMWFAHDLLPPDTLLPRHAGLQLFRFGITRVNH